MKGIINFIRIIEKRPIDITVRRFREIRHEVMRTMGLYWHRNMLPKHFEPNADNVYKYQRRTRGYQERKERAAKNGRSGVRIVDRRAGADKLTFSGTLRINVTQIATIRSFEQRFKLVMPGTPYTPDRPRRPGQPPIAQEVTRLLEREKKELAKLGKSIAVQLMNETRSARTTEIK